MNINNLAKLNALFGGYELFENQVDLMCALGGGFTINLAGPSPLKPVKLRPPKEDGTVWTEWVNLPDTGEFSFRVPEFAFNFTGGRWRASGGMESEKALTLPMGILKRTLDRSKLPNPFALLPDQIPLTELDLKNDALYDVFEDLFGNLDDKTATVLNKLTDILRDGLDRVPANMDEYLKINIPRTFTFDISVEPTGGYAIGLSVDGEPLRVLLPWMSVTGPALFGITLRYFSFGLSAGGSMAVVKCDAWFDQFSLIDLIFALVTGKGRNFSNRFEMRKTTALIPVAAPFPVPLFYERFGWSYRDFIGLNLQAHAGFGPTEPPPLMDWFALIETLFKFFTDKGHYLHQHDIPESMQLPFTLEPAFVALPDYLGGAALGNQRTLPTLPVSQTLAKALDGIKAGNIGWIIQSIPLRYPDKPGGEWIRIGSETVVFGPLEFSMAWCITTQDEFQNIILPDPEAKKMLGDANADDMLTCLPSEFEGGGSYESGFIILLKGGLKVTSPLADLFHLTGQFGVASLSHRDFETAVRLKGGFGPEGILELGIEGRIKVDVPDDSPTSTRVTVQGEIYLMVAMQKFALSGVLEVVTGKSFYAAIGLQLTNHLLR